MKSISFFGLFAFVMFFLGSAVNAHAVVLDGEWINKDPNTGGITKVIFANTNTQIHAYGKCHPTDCDWNTTTVQQVNSNFFRAFYNQGFATRRLSMAYLANGELCVDVYTNYTDNRTDRNDRYFFKKKPVFIPIPPVIVTPVKVKEDCVKLDYLTAKLDYINGSYKIVDGPNGSHWAFDFGTKKDEAYQALNIIKQYKVTESCFVGRPGPSLEYVLTGGQAPQGALRGEDCVSFNPANIEVKNIGGRWKIVEGNHWIFDFETNETEARHAFAIIKMHGFTKSCFVGRPDPSFQYLRK